MPRDDQFLLCHCIHAVTMVNEKLARALKFVFERPDCLKIQQHDYTKNPSRVRDSSLPLLLSLSLPAGLPAGLPRARRTGP